MYPIVFCTLGLESSEHATCESEDEGICDSASPSSVQSDLHDEANDSHSDDLPTNEPPALPSPVKDQILHPNVQPAEVVPAPSQIPAEIITNPSSPPFVNPRRSSRRTVPPKWFRSDEWMDIRCLTCFQHEGARETSYKFSLVCF